VSSKLVFPKITSFQCGHGKASPQFGTNKHHYRCYLASTKPCYINFLVGKPPSYDIVTRVLDILTGSSPAYVAGTWKLAKDETATFEISRATYLIPYFNGYFNSKVGQLRIVIEEVR